MWYLVLSRSLPEKEEDKQRNYEDHRQWLDDQHRAGRLMFSGPTTDGRYGVYVMLAANLEEAKALAATDPHHQRGIREMDVWSGAPIVLSAWINRPSPMSKPWHGRNKRRQDPKLVPK